jgi:hypothetical protein
MKKKSGKKGIIILIVIIIIVAAAMNYDKKKKEEEEPSTVVITTENNAKNTTETTKATTEKTEDKNDDYAIEILSSSIEENYDGSDVLVIEYSWTNNSKKETSFTFAFNDKVYQNGIECSSLGVMMDDVSAGDGLVDIKPGVTNTIKIGYKLQDKTNAAVEIKDIIKNHYYLNAVIELEDGEGTYKAEDAENVKTSVKIADMYLGEDYSGDDILIVKYEYTNGEDKACAFATEFNDKVFQNGVECKSFTFSDDVDSEPSILYIKPGVTIIVEEGYLLNDTSSDVEIEIKESFTDKEVLSEKRSIN